MLRREFQCGCLPSLPDFSTGEGLVSRLSPIGYSANGSQQRLTEGFRPMIIRYANRMQVIVETILTFTGAGYTPSRCVILGDQFFLAGSSLGRPTVQLYLKGLARQKAPARNSFIERCVVRYLQLHRYSASEKNVFTG